jgi:HlyD family secretion protein
MHVALVLSMDRVRAKSQAPQFKRKALMAALALVVVIGGVTLANIDFGSRRIDRDRLSIETVQRGMMEVKVSANGQLVPQTFEELASQVSGRVAKRHVKAGDAVTAGQLLIELTNPQLVASAEEATSAWEGAVTDLKASEAELRTNVLNQEVTLTQAQFDLERAQVQLEAESRLAGQHIIADVDFKRSKLNVAQLEKTRAIEAARLQTVRNNVNVQLDVKRSRVDQLARALDRAKNQAANLQIFAGISGIVQTVSVEVGQQLQPGSPVGRISQQDQLYAELKVPAREATEVQVGQNVVVDTRRGTVKGVVSRVDPGVTNGTVIVDVDIKDKLPAGARPQMQVEGIIYISRFPNTLYVGKPSYVKADAVVSVYKLDADGRYAHQVTIKVGKISVNHVQVLDGLVPGDRIITSEIGEWQGEERILLN